MLDDTELERQRILAIVASAPRAALDDGRDLVVRTDIVRKIQNPQRFVERFAPNPYDEPMIGGPHEVANQYHSEPDRDPRQ